MAAPATTTGIASGVRGLCFTKSAAEISNALKSLVSKYESTVCDIVSRCQPLVQAEDVPTRELFVLGFHALADADAEASFFSAELTIPALVSGDEGIRGASSEAKKELISMWARTYARADLYACLNAAADGAVTEEEKQLARQVLLKFQHAGAALPTAEERVKVSALDAECAALASQIEQNINEDCTKMPLSVADLEGCGDSFIQSLPRDGDDAAAPVLCSVKAPVLRPILLRASSAETRRVMLTASQQQCMETNGPLLEQLLTTRHAAATALGFRSHAERMMAPKMAATPEKAQSFCTEMLDRLQALKASDSKRLAACKAAATATAAGAGDDAEQKAAAEGTAAAAAAAGCEELNAWDTAYYSDLLKQEELSLDEEALKAFFPLQSTITRLLQLYSSMLGLVFTPDPTLPTWHEEVKAYTVTTAPSAEEEEGGQLVGHLYLDQHPRDGKFGHQMVVPLTPSFTHTATGQRCPPACVNISNLPRPEGDKPALLRFGEMRTLFHELGHVMHCLCTAARFSVLSWAWPMVPWPGGVQQDFLEVPSMALEKLAVEPELLKLVACHYAAPPSAAPSTTNAGGEDEGGKEDGEGKGEGSEYVLPADLPGKLRALDQWMAGVRQTRYFAMALFDMLAHSSAPPYSWRGQQGLSLPQLYAAVLSAHTGIAALPGTHPCASWYHLVIGYDAGYYGYGWSDVYAADVVKAMMGAPGGGLGQQAGGALRRHILDPCATLDGHTMLHRFLGRPPSIDAWCERMGLSAEDSADGDSSQVGPEAE